MRAVRLIWLLGVVACVACGSESGEPQPAPPDALSPDAAPPDAAPPDAAPPDAAPPDALSPDALAPDAFTPDAFAPDAFAPDAFAPDLGPPPTLEECFPEHVGDFALAYSGLNPVMGHHCKGTNIQDIQGVERLVFLGDSVTAGTPPSRPGSWYRALLGERLRRRFGPDLVIDNCSAFGARTDDLLIGKREIPECFPEGGDPRTTLVVFTLGGNDIARWAQDHLSAERAAVEADQAGALLAEGVAWLKDPARFPGGMFVVFANPYEYTDGTGDLESCDLARVAGLSGTWPEGAAPVADFEATFLRVALQTGSDLVFARQQFCGHGFHFDDPTIECYRGPDAEPWFDLTCIHPNDAGHAAFADLFYATISE